MSLKSKIESLLFISNYPLSLKKLSELTGEKFDAVQKAMEELKADYDSRPESGVVMNKVGEKMQMATASLNTKIVQEFIKDETTGELTRASLETLTIIAYRGPATRAEIEQIRGVNCSIILRNLLLRGLIEQIEDKKKMETRYTISFEFMRYLGISDTKELPDFEKLNQSENLQKILKEDHAEV